MANEEKIEEVIEQNMNLIENENFEEFFNLYDVKYDVEDYVNFFYDTDIDLVSYIPDLTRTRIQVKGCDSVKEVDINPAVKEIPNGYFEDCRNLKSIQIPQGVERIGSAAFKDCESLTSLTIPEGVSVLSAGLCMNCKNLVELKLPSTIREIEGSVLNGCPKVKVFIKDSMFTNAKAEGVELTPPRDFMNIIKKKELGGQGRGVHY